MNNLPDHPDIASAERTGYAEGQEPELVGDCESCGGEMYAYEAEICELCERTVHQGCIVECLQCGNRGCKSCLIYDEDSMEWFCDHDDGKLTGSECWKAYIENEAKH